MKVSDMPKGNMKTGRNSALLWVVFGCSVLALVTPLLSSPATSLPVTFVQTIAFEGLVELAFAAWLALAISDRRYRPGRSAVLFAIVAFTAVALVSLLSAPDPHMSFWSRVWRMSGVWWSLHLTAWFLALYSSLRNRADWRQLLGVSCIIAGVVLLIGFSRWLRVPDTTSMGGTLGNPSHMAAYLLPHVFIAVYLAIGNSGLLRKSLLAAAIAFAIGVIMTGSRGGAVALIFGILLTSALLLAVAGIDKRFKLAVAGLAVLAAVGLVAGTLALRSPSHREWGVAHLPSFAERLIYRDFGSDRWFLWSYALQGAAERPLLGWGNEGFAYLYDHHYDPASEARQVFFERWQDRAHNRYLDILVAYGAIGLVAYLSIWVAVFAVIIRRHVRGGDIVDKRRGLSLFALMATVAVYDLFMLETVAQAAVVFLVFGLVASAVKSEDEDTEVGAAGPLRKTVSAVVFLAVIVLSVICTLMPFVRGIQFDEGMGKIMTDPERATEIFETAYGWPNPYRNEMIYAAAYTLVPHEAELPSGRWEPLVRLLASVSRDAADGAPISTRETLMMSQMSRLLAHYEPDAAADARTYAERLRDMAPGKFDGYFEIAEVDLFEDKAEDALKNLELAAERVYVPRREFKSLVEVHKAAAYAMLRDYASVYSNLASASAAKFGLSDEPLPVIMMGKYAQPGDGLPDVLVDYARDIAKSRPDSARTVLAAARISALAGRFKEASDMLDALDLRRFDRAADISAMRQEIETIMSGYVEEETR